MAHSCNMSHGLSSPCGGSLQSLISGRNHRKSRVSYWREELMRCLKDGTQGVGLDWLGQHWIGAGPGVEAFGMNNCDLPSEALTNKKLVRLWHS